jgi:hypothetical protein
MSGRLSDVEYDRRKQFLHDITSLTNAELVEIVRILKKHNFQYSENLNGVFFNIAIVPQDLFEELHHFIVFTNKNRKTIEDRSSLMSTLGVEPLTEEENIELHAAKEALKK